MIDIQEKLLKLSPVLRAADAVQHLADRCFAGPLDNPIFFLMQKMGILIWIMPIQVSSKSKNMMEKALDI